MTINDGLHEVDLKLMRRRGVIRCRLCGAMEDQMLAKPRCKKARSR